MITNAGRVELTAALDTNVTVTLTSENTERLLVTEEVTITAGESFGLFDLTVLDNALQDGGALVPVRANHPAFAPVTNALSVADDEIHHFRFLSIHWLQYAGQPFVVTVDALNVDGVRIAPWQETVPITASGRAGAVLLSRSEIGPFVGGQWTGEMRVLTSDYLVRLEIPDAQGVSEPFHVEPWPYHMLPRHAEDLVEDPQSGAVYASGTAGVGGGQDGLLVIDPATAVITNIHPLSLPPGQIELSPDGWHFYVALNQGTLLQRFDLNSHSLSTTLNLGNLPDGPWWLTDFAFIAGGQDSLLVSVSSAAFYGRLWRYDEGIPNPVSLNGEAYPTYLAAKSHEPLFLGFDSEFFLASLVRFELTGPTNPVNRLAVTNGLVSDAGRNMLSEGDLFFARTGEAVSAGTLQRLGRYDASGLVAVDTALKRTFYLEYSGRFQSRIRAFDRDSFELIDALDLPPISGAPIRFIDWGQHGLAFNTVEDEIWFIQSDLLRPRSAPVEVRLQHTLLTDPPVMGSNVTYRLTASNDGPGPATFIRITNALPVNTALVSFTASTGVATQTQGGFSWILCELPAGEAVTLDFVLIHTQSGWQENLARAVPYESDREWANNTSRLAVYAVPPEGFSGSVTLSLGVEDLIYDPVRGRLLLSVGNSGTTQSNGVAVFNPNSAQVEQFTPMGNRPGALAASGGLEFLYVSMPDAAFVRRLDMATLTTDLDFELGSDLVYGTPYPYFAPAMAVLPEDPHALVAVRHRRPGPMASEFPQGMAVYDDGVARSAVTPNGQQLAITFGTDPSRLFALLIASEGHEFSEYRIDADGIHFDHWTSWIGRGLGLDYAGGLVYSSAGRVLRPGEQTVQSVFPHVEGAVDVEIDTMLNQAFFLVASGNDWEIRAFALDNGTLTRTFTLTNMAGTASSLRRWGGDGLAFRTGSGQLVLLRTGLDVPAAFPDLDVTSAVSPNVARAGEELASRTTVRNKGPGVARDVHSTHAFSPDVTILSAESSAGSCVVTNGSVRCTLGDLLVGASASVSIIITPSTDRAITSVSTAMSRLPDAHPEDNTGITLTPCDVPPAEAVVLEMDLGTHDLAYSPLQGRLLATVDDVGHGLRDVILMMDPETLEIRLTAFTGPEPEQLALSTDGRRLHVGIHSGVQSFELPEWREVGRFSAGEAAWGAPQVIQDLVVHPAAPSLLAVATGTGLRSYVEDALQSNIVSVFFEALAFDEAGANLFGLHGPHYRSDLARMAWSANGASLNGSIEVVQSKMSSPEIKIQDHTLYLPDGHLIDGEGLAILQDLPGIATDSLVELDQAGTRLYFLVRAGAGWSLRIYDAATLIPWGTNLVDGVRGNPSRLVHCGKDRLAFRTSANQLVLLQTPLIPSGPATDLGVSLVTSTNQAQAGEPLTYSILVTNHGPEVATNVMAFLRLPDGVEVVSVQVSQGTHTIQAAELKAAVGTLSAGQAASCAVVVRPLNAGLMRPVVSTFSAAIDPFPANNRASLEIPARLPLGPDSVLGMGWAAVDLVENPSDGMLYATGPGSTISAIDPADGAVETVLRLPTSPRLLELSEDGRFLYFGISNGNAIARMDLDSRQLDLEFATGMAVLDMKVMPGHAGTVVASSGAVLAVYDHGVPRSRTTVDSSGAAFLEFGADTNIVYANGGSLSGGRRFRVIRISETGIEGEIAWAEGLPGGAYPMDFDSGLLYTARGEILDPNPPVMQVDLIPGLGPGSLGAPDVRRDRLCYIASSNTLWQVRVYSAATLGELGRVDIDGVVGSPTSFVLWGDDGLAFSTSGGQVFLVRTSLRPSAPPTDLAVRPMVPDPVLVGEDMRLTTVVTNLGPNAAPEVVLTERLSPALTFVSATASQGNCTESDGQVTCQLQALDPGASAVVTIIANPTQAGRLVNVVSLISRAVELAPSDNAMEAHADVLIAPPLDSVSTFFQPNNHLFYDPVSERLYATFPRLQSSAGVIAIDPVDGRTSAPQGLDDTPVHAAMPGNGSFLYVALDERRRVQRLQLPEMTPDLDFNLAQPGIGSQAVVTKMAAAPEDPDLVALALGWPGGGNGLGLFDRGILRPLLGPWLHEVAFVSPTVMLGYQTGIVPPPSFQMAVRTNGVEVTAAQAYFLQGNFKAAQGRLYTTAGQVLEDQRFLVIETVPPSLVLEPDRDLPRLYSLTLGRHGWVLNSIDLNSGAVVASTPVNALQGYPHSLVRCGGDRLAIGTDSAQILLLRTHLVPAIQQADLAVTQVSSGPWIVSSNQTLILTATNHGPETASHVVLVNRLSPDQTLVGAISTLGVWTQGVKHVSCHVGQLEPGEGFTLTLTVVPSRGSDYVNLVSASSSALDPNPANNVSTLSLPILVPSVPDSVYRLAQATSKLVYDPTAEIIYATVPPSVQRATSALASIDPVTGRVDEFAVLDAEAVNLAVSGDGQYLYVGLERGIVQRFNLTTRQPDLTISVGTNGLGMPFGIADMAAVPGLPESFAVSRTDPGAQYGDPHVAIFDGDVPRPQTAGGIRNFAFSSPEWIVGNDFGGVTFFVNRLHVDETGVSTTAGAYGPLEGDFKVGGGLVFAYQGYVLDDVTLSRLVQIPECSLLEPEPATARLFCLEHYGTMANLNVLETEFFGNLGVVPLSPLRGGVHSLVRCVGDRLALGTTDGEVLIVRSSLALPGPPTDLAVAQEEDLDPASVGQTLSYSIQVTNLGPHQVTNAFLATTFYESVTVLNANPSQGSCSASSNNVECRLGPISPGHSATVTIDVRPSVPGMLIAHSLLQAERADVRFRNNSALTPTTVVVSNAVPAVSYYFLPVSDLDYDPIRGRLYAGVQGSANWEPHSLLEIDPRTGSLRSMVALPGEPGLLEASDDGQFLYIYFVSAQRVRRVDLTTQAVALEFVPGVVSDMAIQPGVPGMWVGALNGSGVVAFLDGQQLPGIVTFPRATQLDFSEDGAVLYGHDGSTTAFSISRFRVTPAGVGVLGNQPHAIDRWGVDIVEAGGTVYTTSGQVIEPLSGATIGSFTPGTGLTVDPATDRLYSMAGQRLLVFDRSTLLPLGYKDFRESVGDPGALTLCGSDRMAWRTTRGQLCVARGIPLADFSLASPGVRKAGDPLVDHQGIPLADFSLASPLPLPSAIAGEPLVSSLTVTNQGPWVSSRVMVTNALPTMAELQSLTVSRGSYTVDAGQWVWDLGTMPDATGATASWTVLPTNQVTMTLTQEIALQSSLPDPVLADNNASLAILVLADNDRDQMPDDWESANDLDPTDPIDAGEDTDMDGMNNLEEYWAGTDPNDPADLLTIAEIAVLQTNVWLRFKGVPGREYSLERRHDLNAPWQPAFTFQLTNGPILDVLDVGGATLSNRFYRVRHDH